MIINIIAITIVIVLILIRVGAFDQNHVIVTYEIKSDKIKEEVNIVLLTDHHGCYYGDEQEDIVDDVKRLKPDIILYGGDIFDDGLPYDNTKVLLRNMMGIAPSFYAIGNHEVRTGESDYLKQLTASYDIKVLDGIDVSLDVKGTNFLIAGVDDPESGNCRFDGLRKDKDAFSILISHRPELINEFNELAYDLVVSGHAHGGQWRIPKLINGVFAPNQGIFPKYAGGKYLLEHTTLIVSRGLARESTTRLIPRIFNQPEIVQIKLVK